MKLEGFVYATVDIAKKVKKEGESSRISAIDSAVELLRVNCTGQYDYIFGIDVKKVGNQMMAYGDAYNSLK